jgi:hypothetical protein
MFNVVVMERVLVVEDCFLCSAGEAWAIVASSCVASFLFTRL